MSTALIFAVGVLVTLLAVTAVVLVGLDEAADPLHSRSEDVKDWEQSIVGEVRARNIAEQGARRNASEE